MLTGMGDARKACVDPNKQIWFVESHIHDIMTEKLQDGPADDKEDKTTMEVDEVKATELKLKSTTGSTLSPEIFISDDNIINTQDSVEIEMDQQEKVPLSNEAAKTNENTNVNEVEKVTQQVPERRSERLKKDANLTTLEKTERAAQRKNLEGSPKISNSFVVSSVDDISHISSDMGVVIDSDVFDTCNLLNDLEKARSDLYLKQLEQNDAPPAVTVVENIDKEKKIPELIWLEDESSTSEDFILVESRKKKIEQEICQVLS
jgi:hypothetical protein